MTASLEEVQAGVEVVNAVAAKLTGPQKVWVLANDDRLGNYTWVFHTEDGARAFWIGQVTNDYTRTLGVLSTQALDELVQDILHGKISSYAADENSYYSLEEVEVLP